MAWLKASMFLKPRPPSSLGLHILTQDRQCNFFFFWDPPPPKKKSLVIFFISLQIPIRSLKILIGYVGTAWSMALINTFLPLMEKNFSCHPWTFLSTLSLMWKKTFLLFLLIDEGNPKYREWHETRSIPNKSFKSLATNRLVPGETKSGISQN